jgi:hypothetical protein
MASPIVRPMASVILIESQIIIAVQHHQVLCTVSCCLCPDCQHAAHSQSASSRAANTGRNQGDGCRGNVGCQEAKYVEGWPKTTSAWAGWSRFDIPVERNDGVHSLLICTSSPLGFPVCHRASQLDNTY